MQLFFFYTVRGNIKSFFQKFVALSANCLARGIYRTICFYKLTKFFVVIISLIVSVSLLSNKITDNWHWEVYEKKIYIFS